MNWNFSIDGTPIRSNFVVALYDPSNPSSFPASPVFQQAITTGFPGPFSVTATGLQAIVYAFYLWDTSGTTPGGTVRNQFSLQPTIQTLQVRADLYLTTDTSPGLSSTSPTYVDPTTSLAGWSYDLEQVGYGTLQVGIGNDYTVDGTTGNWTLLTGNPNTNQKFVVHFLPIVSNQPISVVAPSLVSSYRLLTATTTLTNSDMGKLIAIQGAGTVITVTLPSLSAVSDNQSIFLISSGGVHKNVIIAAAGSDAFQWLQYSNQTTAQTQMILGQSEQMLLIKNAGIWNVVQASDGIKLVGELLYDYHLFPINTIQCSGQIVNRADYPRLWNFVNKLDPSCIVAEGAGAGGWDQTISVNGKSYNPNHGRFSQGDGSTTFRLPKLWDVNYGFMRIVDGSARKASDSAVETIRAHNHTMMGTVNIVGAGGPYALNVTAGNGAYSGGGGDHFGRSTAPDPFLRTGSDCGVGQSSPAETVPSNNGCYLLIRI
jgi:hypothetical protein